MDDVEALAMDPLLWFPHDTDAAADPKTRRVMRKYGAAGYGRWWLLCESLASEPGHALPIATDNDLENLAMTLDVDGAGEATEFLGFLCGVGLLSSDGEKIWSERMRDNALRSGRSRAQRVKAINRRWGRE